MQYYVSKNQTITLQIMNLTEMCKILGTNKEEITGAKRDKDICFNRHLICYFLFVNGVKKPSIAEIVNREWHTVFHSIKVIESFLSVNDKETIEKLGELSRHLAKNTPPTKPIANVTQ